MGKILKLGVSVIWDIFDILGIIPGFAIVIDILGTLLAFLLWGKIGIWYFIIEFIPTVLKWILPPIAPLVLTIHAGLPTMTLIGLFSKKQ